jgi:hypothetical protein
VTRLQYGHPPYEKMTRSSLAMTAASSAAMV